MDRFRLNTNPANVLRGGGQLNKQSSARNLTAPQIVNVLSQINKAEELQDDVYKCYKSLLNAGLSKEVARFYLPLSTYTKIYVQFDLNNLIKFFRLRCSPDAQYEIRVYADAMKKLAKQFFPICLKLEETYSNASWLGDIEKEMIRNQRIPDTVTSKTYRKQLTDLASELNITL